MLRISREMSRKLGKSPSTPAQLAGQQTQAMTAGARLPTEYCCWYSVGSRAPADSLSPPSDTICGLKYFLKIPPHLAQRRTNSSVKRHLRSALQRWHCRLPHVLVSRARQLHRQKTSRFPPPSLTRSGVSIKHLERLRGPIFIRKTPSSPASWPFARLNRSFSCCSSSLARTACVALSSATCKSACATTSRLRQTVTSTQGTARSTRSTFSLDIFSASLVPEQERAWPFHTLIAEPCIGPATKDCEQRKHPGPRPRVGVSPRANL